MLLTFDVEVHWWKLISYLSKAKKFCVTAVQLVIILKMSPLLNSQELAIKE